MHDHPTPGQDGRADRPPPPRPTPVELLRRLRREEAEDFAADTRASLKDIADAAERIAVALETLTPNAGGSE